MSLRQEETRTPRGVHCPAVLLARILRCYHPDLPQSQHSRMLHLLACLPFLPMGGPAAPSRPSSPTEEWGSGWACARCVWLQRNPARGLAVPLCGAHHGGRRGPQQHTDGGPLPGWGGAGRGGRAPRCAALVVRCLYHLAHGRLTRIQRLFGAETCSTPVLNRTQRGLFQLFTRWSTRYCNQDLLRRPRRRGATPAGAAGLRVLLHCQCSAKGRSRSPATLAVDCGTNSASLTWAPSVFGAARFGR